VSSIAHDISGRKRDEELIKSQSLELEQRAAALARSNADLEQFAYVASHDLSEPLRTIAGFCNLLERRYGHRLDGEAAEFLHFIVGGTTRMSELIDDLLAYSRASSAELEFARVACSGLVEEVERELSSPIAEAGIELEVGELPAVVADPVQLRRLFENLLSNAVKFRAGKRPRIWVSAQRDGDAWEFTVADNGIGIEPRFADRVFRMYQRLHGGGSYQGTGIGLAICMRVVERHGGRIWFDARPGGGTAFHFTIPVREV
jgi:light-regulated signal transduction histidine kinase (bacteriophytochrome)